ncbi:MAG: hypothetical protein M3431_11105 [Actinomycetota bacterium]|nr:hypothetical protein [Actinomycetota bacterium]
MPDLARLNEFTAAAVLGGEPDVLTEDERLLDVGVLTAQSRTTGCASECAQ